MRFKILTGEEKYGLLDTLQHEIQKAECGAVKDIYSIMLALLYENIILEHTTSLAESSSVLRNAPDIKGKVADVIAQFEGFSIPQVITQQYIVDFTNLSDKLSMLSTVVAQLKDLLVQVSVSDDADAVLEGGTIQ